MPSLSIVRPESYAGIVAAEAEGIGQAQGERGFHRHVGGVVKVAFRIRSIQVDGGRADSVTQ